MQMRMKMRQLILASLLGLAACGGSDGSGGAAGTGGSAGASGGGSGDMAMTANGCPVLSDKQPAMAGDTWASFAQGFFASYCTRCHSSTLTGALARNGAPTGYDWDQQSAVNAHLAEIRGAVGVGNFMPPSAPLPSCAERQRVVAWIDSGAP
jgi:uncharacterized membrane protein